MAMEGQDTGTVLLPEPTDFCCSAYSYPIDLRCSACSYNLETDLVLGRTLAFLMGRTTTKPEGRLFLKGEVMLRHCYRP